MSNSSLNYLRGRRIWFVPEYVVWGVPASAEIPLVTVETVNGTQRIFYSAAQVGGSDQSVLYTELTDHRGNSLPANIKEPKALPMSKSAENIFIVGREYETGFKIARDSASAGPVTVDLLIMELG